MIFKQELRIIETEVLLSFRNIKAPASQYVVSIRVKTRGIAVS